jgi:hypothetical protein
MPGNREAKAMVRSATTAMTAHGLVTENSTSENFFILISKTP